MACRQFSKTVLGLSLAFLAACSSTSNNTPKEVVKTSPTVIESKHRAIKFKKKGVGVAAINTALALAKKETGQQFDARQIEAATTLVGKKVELVRYTFSKNNSIYVADFKNALMFDSDNANVRSTDKVLLDNFSKLYGEGVFGEYLYIIGHTDTDGSASYNYGLSARRAGSVAAILIDNEMEESKLNLVPAGEFLPKAVNDTSIGKQINRRIEIISADSRALIQAYLRQLKCPYGEICERKLLNIFDVRIVSGNVEMDASNVKVFAVYSPELNNLNALNNALRTGSEDAERKLLDNNDRNGLKALGESRNTFSIPLDMRPVLRLIKDQRRGFTIPLTHLIFD